MKKNKALFLAVLAQVIWGLLAIYWKVLDFLPAYQILVHRMLWSVISLHILIYFLKGRGYSKKLLADRSHRRISLLGGVFITLNWFLYIWSINSGHVLEASLGYYILPLITGLIGLLLGEKLNQKQWLANGFAFVGVLISTLGLGRVPWVALALALTFAIYTYLKKQSPLDAIDSLYTETIFMAPLALIYFLYSEVSGMGISGNFPWTVWLLVATTGVVTALPLLLFGYGARKLPFKIISFIQYLSPSFTFLLGIFLFKEDFDLMRLFSFVFIWLGLGIFTLDQIKNKEKKIST